VTTGELRDRALAAYRHGPDAVVALVAGMVDEVRAELAGVVARIEALEAENATLRARLGTDSHNSGKPPSSDGPGAKPHPRSQRTVSGRAPGGQPGHVGHTLRLVDAPDEVVVHTPAECDGCHRSLAGLPAIRRERRQVVDLPPVRAWVVEHQAETKRCPACRIETCGEFPAGLGGPVQYGPGVATLGVYLTQEQLLPLERTCAVLAEVFGCPISEGTLEHAVGVCHARLATIEAAIKRAIAEAKLAHFDESGLRVGRTTGWLHVASTPRLTFYAAHPKRGRAALDAIGLLPGFRGTAVHDGLASYWQYEQCAHALCNAHHLRELTFIEEQLGQPWAKDLKDLLGECKRAVDAARGLGATELAAETQRAFGARYDAALAAGFAANPPPPPTGQRGRPKRGKAGSLLERLRAHKAATLAFMEDCAIPFDNNQAERDIRMIKVRQKISGCFRTTTGADRFCRIRGYISTLRKQGIPILDALGKAIAGNPPMPATS